MRAKNLGFTLIEVLIAAGLFASILLITNGIFTQFISSQRRNVSEQEIQEDLRLAIEVFAREARTAYASSFALLPPSNSNVGVAIVFRDQNGTCLMHQRQGNTWQRGAAESTTPCDQITYTNFSPLTGQGTIVEQLAFKIPTNILSGNRLARQGFITVMLQAKSNTITIPTLQMQATLTSRQVKPYGQ